MRKAILPAMQWLLLGSALVLGLHAPARAAENQKTADIRRLMKVTGAGDLGKQVMTQMINSMRGSAPSIPSAFWDDFMKEVKTDELVELVVPSYDKHFTHEEIRELIRFYETPTGRKVVREMPFVLQETMQAGQEWGAKLGERAVKRAKEKGYI